MTDVCRVLAGRLVVSCQAPEGSPLRDPAIITALAEAAVLAGAAAVRINSAEHVAAVRERVDVPVIGLEKRLDDTGAQWITPTVADAQRLIDAGADIVAIDATQRLRPDGTPVEEVLREVVSCGLTVMADIDTRAAAETAVAVGAHLIGTTLSGYTAAAPATTAEPDLALLAELTGSLRVPVLAEGRYSRPNQVRRAFSAGAHAVVVGTAITDPIQLTHKFVAATPTCGSA